MPEHLVDEWRVWRLVHAGMISWADATRQNGISMVEVLDANDVLDLFDAANELAAKEQ